MNNRENAFPQLAHLRKAFFLKSGGILTIEKMTQGTEIKIWNNSKVVSKHTIENKTQHANQEYERENPKDFNLNDLGTLQFLLSDCSLFQSNNDRIISFTDDEIFTYKAIQKNQALFNYSHAYDDIKGLENILSYMPIAIFHAVGDQWLISSRKVRNNPNGNYGKAVHSLIVFTEKNGQLNPLNEMPFDYISSIAPISSDSFALATRDDIQIWNKEQKEDFKLNLTISSIYNPVDKNRIGDDLEPRHQKIHCISEKEILFMTTDFYHLNIVKINIESKKTHEISFIKNLNGKHFVFNNIFQYPDKNTFLLEFQLDDDNIFYHILLNAHAMTIHHLPLGKVEYQVLDIHPNGSFLVADNKQLKLIESLGVKNYLQPSLDIHKNIESFLVPGCAKIVSEYVGGNIITSNNPVSFFGAGIQKQNAKPKTKFIDPKQSGGCLLM